MSDRMLLLTVIVVALVLVVLGPFGSDGDDDDYAPPTTTKASLFLDRYPLSMKEELDRYADNKECANLQFKFDYTADSKDSLRRMYGRNGYDILQYIDDLMVRAGCY